ncbi:polyketide cyclase [Mycobacterium sp. MS1601]|nr:polyketide cyclase [Mycobacterium sp. MS1601]
MQSRHVSIVIDAAAADVAAYIRDPRNLVHWAAGLADGQVQLVDGAWTASSPLGDITVEFAPDNDLGVVDHVVRTAQGQTFYNPMRVLRDGEVDNRCEVVFTVRRRVGMSDAEFAGDAAAVAADLETLRGIFG